MAKLPKSPRPELTKFASRLSMMMHEADQLGLHATARAINEATRKVGYEIADVITKQTDGGGNGRDRKSLPR